ncbi:hypothetical protein HY948_01365 [Candidatus Gottesmanbacteria bacterium]|nr:hypothetical protein [Candidatus Gottesmanbacteria bacterium]
MNLTGPGTTYILLVIPALFAGAVMVQGIYKIIRHESDGKIALGFGVLFCLLILAAYFLFIK